MNPKYTLMSVATIAVVLGIYLAVRSNIKDDTALTQQVIRESYIAAEGKIVARPGKEAEIGSELTARIDAFLVKEGERVAADQVVAILASKDLDAQLRQAKAELAVARAKFNEIAAGVRPQELEQAQAALQRAVAERELADKELVRLSELFKDNVVSRSALDQAQSNFDIAVARVREANEQLELLKAGAKAQTLAFHKTQILQAEANVAYFRTLLDKTRVKSPISGTLIKRYFEQGEVAIPEKPIAVIADTDDVRINAEVDETDAGRLHLGDAVDVTSYAYPGRHYKGRVEEIADYVGKREIKPNNPAANLGLKVIQVKIALLEPTPLKLGMTVDVRITPAEVR